MEQWKSLKGIIECGDLYEVSSLGNVRNSKTGRAKIPTLNPTGYRSVAFSLKGKTKRYQLHRVVALAFIPNPDDKPLVNHLDGNKENCELSNLEWATYSENTQHAVDTGLRAYTSHKAYNAVLTEEQVVEIKQLLVKGVPQTKIAKMFDVSKGAIENIQHGINWANVVVEGFTPFKKEGGNNSKLNAEKVSSIRKLYATGDYTYKQLADKFNVTNKNIMHIVKRRTWAHVE